MRSPSVGKQINKLWYIQTSDYYLVIKKRANKLKKWRNLKCYLNIKYLKILNITKQEQPM